MHSSSNASDPGPAPGRLSRSIGGHPGTFRQRGAHAALPLASIGFVDVHTPLASVVQSLVCAHDDGTATGNADTVAEIVVVG